MHGPTMFKLPCPNYRVEDKYVVWGTGMD